MPSFPIAFPHENVHSPHEHHTSDLPRLPTVGIFASLSYLGTDLKRGFPPSFFTCASIIDEISEERSERRSHASHQDLGAIAVRREPYKFRPPVLSS